MSAARRWPSFIVDLLETRDSSSEAFAPAPAASPRAARASQRTSEAQTGQRSLFGEILDWMLAPLLLLWPLSVGVTFLVARSLADAPYDRALVDQAEVLTQQIQELDGRPLVPEAAKILDLLSPGERNRIYFQVAASDGELLAGDPGLPAPALYDFAEAGTIKLRADTFHGSDVRVAYLRLDAAEQPHGNAYPLLVQVAERLDRRSALANEIIKGVIFPQFLILPLTVALVWFGLTRGLAPLKRMRDRIHDRGPDDLSPIDPSDAPEEIYPLLSAFNELLVRLNESIRAQKRFIADAAHQMKTPLAGLKTQAELALRERDPEQMRHSLRQLAIGSDRAAHLISQLLSLARMENLRDVTPFEPLDLGQLARSVAEEWFALAAARGIDFGFEAGEESATVNGHRLLLREMFSNLIDNALKYTAAGGHVTVRVGAHDGEVVFEVEDSGPGIPPPERELVFERFHRVLGTESDGSGLGLAIVREIAIQHGATVLVNDPLSRERPGGTRMTVNFAASATNAPAIGQDRF